MGKWALGSHNTSFLPETSANQGRGDTLRDDRARHRFGRRPFKSRPCASGSTARLTSGAEEGSKKLPKFLKILLAPAVLAQRQPVIGNALVMQPRALRSDTPNAPEDTGNQSPKGTWSACKGAAGPTEAPLFPESTQRIPRQIGRR